MSNILYPINISFMDWASQIRIDLPNMEFPNPESEKEWISWASQVLNLNSLQNIPQPDKTLYPKEGDWIKWAANFIDIVYNS